MPSPFPGMNPYLETASGWPDFHMNYLMTLQRALAKRLAGRYFVKCEMRVSFHEPSAEERLAGVAVAAIGLLNRSTPRRGDGATITAPLRLPIPVTVEEGRDRWLEVVETTSRRVVTVIELLSPSNKTNGRGREEYLAKRRQLFHGDAHFVEIDLLRGGARPVVPTVPACDYYALVRQADDRESVGVWPINLRDRLPEIPIPLSGSDAPVMMDLQAMLDSTYDDVAYEYEIYGHAPEPPLAPADAAWAAGFVPAGRGAVN